MIGHSYSLAAAEGRVWSCPSCAEDREFLQPPCVDGHTADGGDCPEWVCTDCGTAVSTPARGSAADAAAGRAA